MNISTLVHTQDITLPSDGVTATKTFTLVHLKRSLDTCDRQQVKICYLYETVWKSSRVQPRPVWRGAIVGMGEGGSGVWPFLCLLTWESRREETIVMMAVREVGMLQDMN